MKFKIDDMIKDALKNIDSGIEELDKRIREHYNVLLSNQEYGIRINDKNNEGIFFVNKRGYLIPKGEEIYIGCSKDNLEKEPAYSRAIFNKKEIKLDNAKALLVAYEAPLFRQKHGKNLSKSLDLVALQKNKILLIECKWKDNEATNIAYGFLQSFAYGIIMALHKKKKENFSGILQQIDHCLEFYHGKKSEEFRNLIDLPDTDIVFLIAAPQEYYKNYLNDDKLIFQTNLEKNVQNYLKKYIDSGLKFGGYIIIGDGKKDIIPRNEKVNDKNIIKPELNINDWSFPVYKTFEDLHRQLK